MHYSLLWLFDQSWGEQLHISVYLKNNLRNNENSTVAKYSMICCLYFMNKANADGSLILISYDLHISYIAHVTDTSHKVQ